MTFLSDYFDHSIYVHADERDARRWRLQRFLRLRAQATDAPSAYFNRFARLSERLRIAQVSAATSL